MFAETENQSKLGELRKNKAESFTVKTGKHISRWFALAFYYIEGIKPKNEYLFILKKIAWIFFVEKMDEVLNSFATSFWKKW